VRLNERLIVHRGSMDTSEVKRKATTLYVTLSQHPRLTGVSSVVRLSSCHLPRQSGQLCGSLSPYDHLRRGCVWFQEQTEFTTALRAIFRQFTPHSQMRPLSLRLNIQSKTLISNSHPNLIHQRFIAAMKFAAPNEEQIRPAMSDGTPWGA